MPISEAIRERPDLVKKYLGTVVPTSDNFFATLNSAVFSDGSFVYVPPGVRCPMELSTYFRVNERNTGQFGARADHRRQGSLCQLSRRLRRAAARREPTACRSSRTGDLDDAEIKYSTVQTGTPAIRKVSAASITSSPDAVTRGDKFEDSWNQVETGSAITWKYPSASCAATISRGEFYSIAISNGRQQVDGGTRSQFAWVRTPPAGSLQGHRGRGVSETPIAASVTAHRKPPGARDFTACDSLLIGRPMQRAHRALYRGEEFFRAVRAQDEQSKISEDMMLYCVPRG